MKIVLNPLLVRIMVNNTPMNVNIIDVLLTAKVFVPIVITLLLFTLCFSYIPKKSLNKKGRFDKDGIEILEIEEVFK